MHVEPKEELSLSELKESFETLTRLPAWVRLCQAIQAQVDSLQSEILFSEVAGEGDLYRLERRKGMLEGRLSIQATAHGMLESILQDIRSKNSGEE